MPFLATALVGGALILLILSRNNGVFTYTLDDPYIHLALSEQIRHGHYGINAAEYSAPASSILYPILLVPGAGTGIHLYLPLIINILCVFGTIEILRRLLIHLHFADTPLGTVTCSVFLVVLTLCTNLLGVAFTGLEHSAHIAATASIIYGVVLFLDTQRLPLWLPAVIVIAPLLRYEALALSITALAILALRGRWRIALGTLALIVTLVGAFSAFLLSLGLPALPSSILTKSTVAETAIEPGHHGLLKLLASNALATAEHSTGIILLLAAMLAAIRVIRSEPVLRPWRWSSAGLMSMMLVGTVTAHALVGRFGWFERYEVYVILSSVMIGLYLARSSIAPHLSSGRNFGVVVFGMLALFLVAGVRYVMAAARVPLAANNIYEQHYQMHRFVSAFYNGPVAVNDIGLVSYRNPNYVLDLSGLSSERARQLDASGAANPGDYDKLVRDYGVGLVIIYDDVLGELRPSRWTRLASLSLSGPRITPAQETVQFYSSDASNVAALRDRLQAFGRTLPPGIKFVID